MVAGTWRRCAVEGDGPARRDGGHVGRAVHAHDAVDADRRGHGRQPERGERGAAGHLEALARALVDGGEHQMAGAVVAGLQHPAAPAADDGVLDGAEQPAAAVPAGGAGGDGQVVGGAVDGDGDGVVGAVATLMPAGWSEG